jgi:hypothetical protein
LIAHDTSSLNAGPSFPSFHEFDKFKKSAENQISAINCSLLEINTNLQEIEIIRSEVKSLWKLNEELQSRIERLDEKSTENSLEIIGITICDSDDLPSIVKTVGENIGCLVWPCDIRKIFSCRSIKNNRPQDKIVVEFSNQIKKEEFLKAGRNFSRQSFLDLTQSILPEDICEPTASSPQESPPV